MAAQPQAAPDGYVWRPVPKTVERVLVVTDVPKFVAPLVKQFDELGHRVSVLDLREFVVSVAAVRQALKGVTVLVNRLSAAADGEQPGLLVKAREFMEMVEMLKEPYLVLVVNDAFCQRVASSKVLQAAVTAQAGEGLTAEPTVATYAREDAGAAWRAAVAEASGAPLLQKPNVGAYGRGVEPLAAADGDKPEPPQPPPASMDGVTVYQGQLLPTDLAQPAVVYRAELVFRQIMYVASTPFLGLEPACGSEGTTNFCVRSRADDVTLAYGVKGMHARQMGQLSALAKHAHLDLGSIEFFVRADGTMCVFDINPVSSLHPRASELIGADPYAVHASNIITHARADRMLLSLPEPPEDDA